MATSCTVLSTTAWCVDRRAKSLRVGQAIAVGFSVCSAPDQLRESAQTWAGDSKDPRAADAKSATDTENGAGPATKPEHSSPRGGPFQRFKSDAGLVKWNNRQFTLSLSNKRGGVGGVPNLWLRDSCACHLCVDPDSGQKNFSTTDLEDEPQVQHAELTPDGSLKIIWASDPVGGADPHITVFPAEELAAWCSEGPWQRGRVAKHYNPRRILWDRAKYEDLLAHDRCRVSYMDWMDSGDAFWNAMTDLRNTGMIFVTDVPQDESEVQRIASRIGPMQYTFYGWTWDVRSKPQAENVAYTSQFLGLHQDLMYHDPIPGLQLLHCLSNTCEGGESLFSHGIRAADQLKAESPELYNDLATDQVWFTYRKGEHHYYRAHTAIIRDRYGGSKETRWAPMFQATFPQGLGGPGGLRRWKRAATAFQKIVESESNMVEVKLKEGECVIFDNRQILHGRRQFTAAQGSRWLKGTYITQQTYLAKVTALEKEIASRKAQPEHPPHRHVRLER
ncbi:Clavaminate synthase-like protein [Parathielavia hyrcaniae]|uniref:Clavaminate synthase-like protein n=1 Tax=Parathielavia hyrcaniae TaxID=113614 RepID=A0AAN6Q0B5_9PEZI|nr:Clavaminate synthase-like protein [Parathielavia hyrcaniae]